MPPSQVPRHYYVGPAKGETHNKPEVDGRISDLTDRLQNVDDILFALADNGPALSCSPALASRDGLETRPRERIPLTHAERADNSALLCWPQLQQSLVEDVPLSRQRQVITPRRRPARLCPVLLREDVLASTVLGTKASVA